MASGVHDVILEGSGGGSSAPLTTDEIVLPPTSTRSARINRRVNNRVAAALGLLTATDAPSLP